MFNTPKIEGFTRHQLFAVSDLIGASIDFGALVLHLGISAINQKLNRGMKMSNIKITPAYMKAGQAAEYLGISRRFLHDLSKRGRIPYAQLGKKVLLYKRMDLDQVVAKLTVGGAA